jgi:aminopeptidase-like protein
LIRITGKHDLIVYKNRRMINMRNVKTKKHQKSQRSERKEQKKIDEPIMKTIKDIWFTRRDLISDGFDEAANYLKRQAEKSARESKNSKSISVKIHEIPTGTKCWTWTVPDKWDVKKAWIKDDKGKKILDLKDHPLHVMSYSLPINKTVSKEELLRHLHTNQQRPNAIPFEFKYYEKDWGFCMEHNKLGLLTASRYQVHIDSNFKKGALKIVDITIKGLVEDMIVLVAHLCHPCMVNDDLTGVAVGLEIAKLLMNQKNHYTYKILFLPETIGSIAYLSQNEELIPKMKYGLFLEMLGNNNTHALQYSRQGNTLLDRIAKNVMQNHLLMFREGAFRKIVGNDEMVFNGPGIDIPMISISRWPYAEYHTSDDNPDIATEERLEESKKTILEIIRILDSDYYPRRTFKGPLFLSGYGLWVDWRINKKLNSSLEQIFLRFEGDKSIFDIAEELELKFDEVLEYVNKFHAKGLVIREYH